MKTTAVFDRHGDPLRHNPDGMVEKLFAGNYRPFRGEAAVLPGDVGVLSIWTRDPTNVLSHRAMRDALRKYKELGIPLELHVSVTGYGGRFSFLELDVPTPENVRDMLQAIIHEGLVTREWIKIRIDPVYTVRIPAANGQTFEITNMRRELFSHIVSLFRQLGISRFLSSHRDAGNYESKKARVAERFGKLGIELVKEPVSEVVAFFESVQPLFNGLLFGLCGNPPAEPRLRYQACIDNAFYMTMTPGLVLSSKRCSSRCGQCFKGVTSVTVKGAKCYAAGSGCLICYAQRTELGKAERRFRAALEQFAEDPDGFRGQLPDIYSEMCTPC